MAYDPYWGNQNPEGTKTLQQIQEERKTPQPDPGNFRLPSSFVGVTSPPPTAPPGEQPANANDPTNPVGIDGIPYGLNPNPQAAQLESAAGQALPGLGSVTPSGVPQSTMVPGLGGPAKTLPVDLPPNLAIQFKDNAAAQGALIGSPYQDLGKLKVWSGGKAIKDIPYGGSLASDKAAAAGTNQYGGIATETDATSGNVNPIGDSVTGAQYMDKWFNMSQKERDKLMQKFVKAGILTPEQATSNALGNDSDSFGQRVWASLIQNAALQWSTSGTRITPEGVLDNALAKGTSAVQTHKTDVAKAFNISDGMTANKALSGMLTERLGRLPTKAEKAAFLSALNAYERSNPTVRTTTTNVITGDSTSTTKGGADSAGFTDEYAREHNKKEYGAVQGATTYYKAFMDLIGA
jgi:hypothetical protein